MPWGVKKSGNKWAIYRKDTGKIVGYSDSKEKAEASVRARYAHSSDYRGYQYHKYKESKK